MKVFNKIRSLSHKSKVAIVVLALGVGVAIPVVNAEFAPARATYDYNKFDPNNLNCNDPNNPAAQHGRCGSLTGPVFNSFINTPSYGDERTFFDGRRSDQAASATADTIPNVNEGSKEVILRIYVHNNANQDTDCLPAHLTNTGCSQIDNNAPGIAHNTRVRIQLPTDASQVARATAFISADNATTVSDTTDMTGTEKFTATLVPGSAKLLRDSNQYALSDSIADPNGALIGDSAMDGNLPGCFNFAALIEVHVRINVVQTPQLQLVKEVKIKGAPSWSKEVNAKPGDDVQWRLGTKDISNSNLDNVVVRDVLPPHVQVVPGSVRLITTTNDDVQPDGPLFAGGFNVGNYVPGSTQYVIFDTTAEGDFTGCSVRVRNIAHARSDQTPTEQTDTSDVIITKENCNTPPAYSCDLLTATPGDNRTATFTTNATAGGGATITMYSYDFGDNTPVLNTDKASVTHTYAKPGQYASHVTVQFNVNGQVQTASGAKCAAVVNFPTTPNTPPTTTTPGTPTTLVNTGPGEVAGIFGATTAFGAVAYRWMLGRRLAR